MTLDDDIARWLRARAAIRQCWSTRRNPLVRRWIREWLMECRIAQDSVGSYGAFLRDEALDTARRATGHPDLYELACRVG